MLPTVPPDRFVDKETRSKMVQLVVKQQIAKCEKALASDMNTESMATVSRYLEDLKEIDKMMDEYHKGGVGKIWRRPKALAKLLKKMAFLREKYKTVEIELLEKIDREIE